MIQANELRIGNKLMFQPLGKKDRPTGPARMIEVKEIGQKTILVIDPIGLDLELFYGDKSLLPIPLSPDVLERCGFKDSVLLLGDRGSCSLGWHLSASKTTVNLAYDYDDCAYASHNAEHGYDLKYLHQLQNLYYSLTGQELIYKND